VSWYVTRKNEPCMCGKPTVTGNTSLEQLDSILENYGLRITGLRGHSDGYMATVNVGESDDSYQGSAVTLSGSIANAINRYLKQNGIESRV
jgi:hypothetical protein